MDALAPFSILYPFASRAARPWVGWGQWRMNGNGRKRDMAYLVELPVTTEGGPAEVVKVQLSGPPDGLVKATRPGQVVARASRSLGEMLAGIRPVAENFVDSFRAWPTHRMRSPSSSACPCPPKPMW
jgi:hypothetical protein